MIKLFSIGDVNVRGGGGVRWSVSISIFIWALKPPTVAICETSSEYNNFLNLDEESSDSQEGRLIHETSMWHVPALSLIQLVTLVS